MGTNKSMLVGYWNDQLKNGLQLFYLNILYHRCTYTNIVPKHLQQTVSKIKQNKTKTHEDW